MNADAGGQRVAYATVPVLPWWHSQAGSRHSVGLRGSIAQGKWAWEPKAGKNRAKQKPVCEGEGIGSFS